MGGGGEGETAEIFEIGPSGGFMTCLNYSVCLFFILSLHDRGHVFLHTLHSAEHGDGALLNAQDD